MEEVLARQQAAEGKRPRLGVLIHQLGLATEDEVAAALAAQLGLPFLDLATVPLDPGTVEMVPRTLAYLHHLVPIERTADDGLLIAMADPTNVVAIDDVRIATGVREVRVAVATASAVQEAADRLYGLEGAATDLVNRLGVATGVEVLPELDIDEDDVDLLRRSTNLAPIVRLANAVFADAVRGRATDIHVEPQASEVKIRYRIDGLLREVMTLPKHTHAAFVSRIKIISGMDIAERRRPQDGRGKIRVESVDVDTRVSAIPTLTGEKVVIRLLRKGEGVVGFPSIGMDPDELETLSRALAAPQGLIVLTGPTGSGKTTTLYAALTHLKTPDKNVVTLEDPIEYEIPGINQTQIDEKTGITFARGLRTILRQDPNVIMVGEIRDAETAEIAAQAALTGHLVLTTLHTNDAASAVTRLVDLGVEPFLIASSLSLVVAQRLVRTICDRCRTPAEPSERTLELLGIGRRALDNARLFRGEGCEACGYTGFRGRTGLFELLPVSSQMREQIAAQPSEAILGRAARAAGHRSLRQNGLAKALAGITTLEEVLRVTYVDAVEAPSCPSCRQEIDRSFVACPYCQAELGPAGCPSCGKPTEPGWGACPYCRADLRPVEIPSERPRVLAIDDDPSISALLSAVMGDEFEVEAVRSGEEGIRRATVARPDLILLDLGLPDMRGTEVAQRLRESVATSLIPIIMLTGFDDAEMESLRAGVDDYVTKPFDPERLRARMQAALRRVARSLARP